MFSSIVFLLFITSLGRCDITNVQEFLNVFQQNLSTTYSVGFVTEANANVVKGYLMKNTKNVFLPHKSDLLSAIDNETVIAGVTTSTIADDLEPRYHVFSSLILSPQAMILAPDFHSQWFPYGLQNQSSRHLFEALNAAIVDMQRTDADETLFTKYKRPDVPRAYTCRQDSPLLVVNRNDSQGFLRDIIVDKQELKIGGLGPVNWGVHDGDYTSDTPVGLYPELLQTIVEKLGELKGPDGEVYGKGIRVKRSYYQNATSLFRDLLDGKIHATDLYLFIDTTFQGTGESCVNDSSCLNGIPCISGFCTYPERPRSLHFRTTCTVASSDTKFITKKNSRLFPDIVTKASNTTTPAPTTKPRWVGFILLFVVFFSTIFLILLVLVRRKKNYRIEHTLPGGFGKFARLQEELEPPLEGMDSFDDHIVQSPREATIPNN